MRIVRTQHILVAAVLVSVIASLPLVRAVELDTEYNRYNLSFKYPKQLSFDFETGNEVTGTILGHLLLHVLGISWVTSPHIEPKDLTQQFDNVINFVAQHLGLGKPSLGVTGQSVVQNYSVTYQRLSAEYSQVQVDGGIGAWYCDKTQRLFTLIVVDVSGGFDLFQQYLASFDCHPYNIPGFPAESILIGFVLALAVLTLQRRYTRNPRSRLRRSHLVLSFSQESGGP